MASVAEPEGALLQILATPSGEHNTVLNRRFNINTNNSVAENIL